MDASPAPDRQRLAALHHAVLLAADAGRVALDHVTTLLTASQGRRTSGPNAGREAPGRLVRLLVEHVEQQRTMGRPYFLDDQLRRGRRAVAELADEVRSLAALATDLVAAGVDASDVARLTAWEAPQLESAGSRRSVPSLQAAREQVATVGSLLAKVDGRLRLALVRGPVEG